MVSEMREFWMHYDWQGAGKWCVSEEPPKVVRPGSEVIHVREVAALSPDASAIKDNDVAGVVEFLNEAARYFENCPEKGEDRAFWANVYNADNCRKAANLIARLSTELAEARADAGQAHADLFATQDGALVQDLRGALERTQAERIAELEDDARLRTLDLEGAAEYAALLKARATAAEAERDRRREALMGAERRLTYPVDTSINPRGYALREDEMLHESVRFIRTALVEKTDD